MNRPLPIPQTVTYNPMNWDRAKRNVSIRPTGVDALPVVGSGQPAVL